MLRENDSHRTLLKSADERTDVIDARFTFQGGTLLRRKLTAVVLAVLVFSLIAASAASLGPITVNDDLGASTAVVSSCDTDGVTVDLVFEQS